MPPKPDFDPSHVRKPSLHTERFGHWRDWPVDRTQWDREVAVYEDKYRPLIQGLIRPTELVGLLHVVQEEITLLNEEMKRQSTETMRERGPNLAGRMLGNQRP